MKKLILVTVFVLSGFLVQSQELNWHTDVKTAAEQSMKEGKPLILFFTGSDWCIWCKRLVKDVYSTEEFKKWAGENVVLSVLDFPTVNKQDANTKNQNGYLKNLLKIKGFPTVVFTNPKITEKKTINLNELGRLGYAKNEKIWLSNAKVIMSRLKKVTEK